MVFQIFSVSRHRSVLSALIVPISHIPISEKCFINGTEHNNKLENKNSCIKGTTETAILSAGSWKHFERNHHSTPKVRTMYLELVHKMLEMGRRPARW
ncbi:unnamed protein product [Timema podura]|uniref:Secreted protein n=1 Tax=Timema podura TaxID=61482 RepID=A0ABN7P4X2_TIMPD|nr:unnamed protein product [Timema podura]